MPRADWVRSYLELTKEQESPNLFHLYCGFFALSAVLGRKVYVDRGFYRIYPNIYVVLVAGSGMCRKTSAIQIAEGMIRMACPDLEFVAQKITPEALFGVLHRRFKVFNRSEAIISAEELGVFLGAEQKNLDLVQLLTKIYNCPEMLDYETKGRGREVASKAFATMIAGTTPDWMRLSLPSSSTSGGFTSRCLFIYQNTPRQRKAMPFVDPARFEELAKDLAGISLLEGPMVMETDAWEWYKHWYEVEYHPGNQDADLDGYFSRKHDMVVKIAMLLSASERADMKLSFKDMKAALNLIEHAEKYLTTASKAIQTTDDSSNMIRVFQHIKRAGNAGITHSNLLRRLSYKLSATTIRDHIIQLKEAQVIETFADGGNTAYRATGDSLEEDSKNEQAQIEPTNPEENPLGSEEPV